MQGKQKDVEGDTKKNPKRNPSPLTRKDSDTKE